MSGRDWEPPVLVGKGEVCVHSPDRFEFTLTGRATNFTDAFRRFRKAQDNPYDTFEQFRLIGTDERGVHWAFGWTTPTVGDVSNGEWQVHGSIQTIATDARNESVSGQSSAENIIEFQAQHTAIPIIGGFTSQTADGHREHEIETLGTRITFNFEPTSRQLFITCPTNETLTHPYLENWLAEPFRIIFGQLIYPSLVARNFGDGRAMVDLRRAPKFIPHAGFAALWAADIGAKSRDTFWKLYALILQFIAGARSPGRQSHLGSNLLTQFYEEIVQAARGTRWVWALTLASVIEGQSKMLKLTAQPVAADNGAVASLTDHIQQWTGSNDLKSRAIGEVKRVEQLTATRVLAQLRDKAIIADAELASWKSIRNEVMHGTLISPWSQKDEDEKLHDLAKLFHKLTAHLLKPSE